MLFEFLLMNISCFRVNFYNFLMIFIFIEKEEKERLFTIWKENTLKFLAKSVKRRKGDLRLLEMFAVRSQLASEINVEEIERFINVCMSWCMLKVYLFIVYCMYVYVYT